MLSLDARDTVLVVERDDELRENIGECLELERHCCWLEASSTAGLHRMGEERRAPDLILLDYRTVGLSAQEFVHRLKENAAWGNVPVVLMAAAWDREVPHDLPFDGMLIKPFDMTRLMHAVREAMRPDAARPALSLEGPT